MKVLSALFTLALIALVIFFSEALYVQGEYILSYALVVTSIVSVIFWIQKVSSEPGANATAGENSKA